MNRKSWLFLAAACAAAAGALAVLRAVPDRNGPAPGGYPVYSPYPPGLIPADLERETLRVQKEIDQIQQEAMAEWRALPKPVLAGNPPVLSGSGSRSVQILGKLENFDRNLSVNKNQACAFCHMPYTGFTGPISSINATTATYPGSVHYRFGKRTPQTYTYSPFSPVLQYNAAQQNFYGGNFWDGRATGYKLQSPDAEQAQNPPVDSQEMGFPDTACVVFRLSQAAYRPLFEMIWGSQAFQINWPSNAGQICSTPQGASVLRGNATPLNLSPADRNRANSTYDNYAQSITAYEASPDVSPASAKFDQFLNSDVTHVTLTADEIAGYNLFRGKGNCNSCHIDGRSTALKKGRIDNGDASCVRPLFTDHSASNLGIPRNPSVPFYYQTAPDAFGFTPNPKGFQFIDLGFGLFLRGESGTNPNSNWAPLASAHDGQVRTPTLRNVDMRPCSTFVRAYMHNGYLKSLKEVVHFYNTRDVYKKPVTSGHCPAGTTEKIDCWPMPEVSANVDTSVGSLGLTDHEENLIVLFMQTLTDGYSGSYPDSNVFSGKCQ